MCLNSLISGWTDQQIEDVRDGGTGERRVAPRSRHDADEGRRTPGDEGGDPEDLVIGHRRLVHGAEGLARPSLGDGGEDLVVVDPVLLQDLPHHGVVAQVASVVVPGREQGEVDVEEPLREPVADDEPGFDGHQVRGLLRHLPHGSPALLDMGLRQREGDEVDVPVGAPSHGVDHVLVDVAGEGAPVVEGHGERRCCSWCLQRRPGGPHSSAARPRPPRTRHPSSDVPEGHPERGPGHDIGGVVLAQMDPAERHRRRHQVIGRSQGVVVGQEGGRAPGGEGVTRGEARRAWHPDRSGIVVSSGPGVPARPPPSPPRSPRV